MYIRRWNLVGLPLALCVSDVSVGSGRADSPKLATPDQARKAVERGLDFLRQDAVKWRTDRKCATCHHGTMTVWALSEAKAQGSSVAADALADLTKWTRERLDIIDKPRDTRPGWNMFNTPALRRM